MLVSCPKNIQTLNTNVVKFVQLIWIWKLRFLNSCILSLIYVYKFSAFCVFIVNMLILNWAFCFIICGTKGCNSMLQSFSSTPTFESLYMVLISVRWVLRVLRYHLFVKFLNSFFSVSQSVYHTYNLDASDVIQKQQKCSGFENCLCNLTYSDC